MSQLDAGHVVYGDGYVSLYYGASIAGTRYNHIVDIGGDGTIDFAIRENKNGTSDLLSFTDKKTISDFLKQHTDEFRHNTVKSPSFLTGVNLNNTLQSQYSSAFSHTNELLGGFVQAALGTSIKYCLEDSHQLGALRFYFRDENRKPVYANVEGVDGEYNTLPIAGGTCKPVYEQITEFHIQDSITGSGFNIHVYDPRIIARANDWLKAAYEMEYETVATQVLRGCDVPAWFRVFVWGSPDTLRCE